MNRRPSVCIRETDGFKLNLCIFHPLTPCSKTFAEKIIKKNTQKTSSYPNYCLPKFVHFFPFHFQVPKSRYNSRTWKAEVGRFQV